MSISETVNQKLKLWVGFGIRSGLSNYRPTNKRRKLIIIKVDLEMMKSMAIIEHLIGFLMQNFKKTGGF